MSNMNTPVNENASVRKRIANETIATAPRSINREQENVIKKLEEALNILRQIEVKNEDCFDIIDEPLNDFLFNLKYLPTDPSFDIFPTEIKKNIFSYLCDSGAFVAASVCLEWKDIMKPRLKKMDEVKIGLHCSNKYECDQCFMPKEVLKASIALKSDVPLSLCHDLPYVDSKLITEGLASASSLSIKGRCDCRGVTEDEDPILTRKQFKELFKALDRKSDVMNSLKLIDLDLTWLNQKKLTNFLLSVTRSLTLDEGEFGTMLNVTKFVRKLSQVDGYSHELRSLKLLHLDYSDVCTDQMADALCNVFIVHLFCDFPLEIKMIERLIENIVMLPTTIRVLGIYQCVDWRNLVDKDDLKTLLAKMWKVSLVGAFNEEQVEAVRYLPNVAASLYRIVKKPNMKPQQEDGDGVEGEDKYRVEDEDEDEDKDKDKDEDDDQPN